MSWHPGGTPLGRSDRRDAVGFFVVALAAYWICCPGPTGYTQYARFAPALSHGSLSLPERPPALEMAEWQGRAYFTNPPTPALLLVPLVWLAEHEPLKTWFVEKHGGLEPSLGYLQTYLSLLVGA